MKKSIVVPSILVLIIIIITFFAIFEFNKNTELLRINGQLEADNIQLSSDKEQVIVERELCRTDLKATDSELSMLEEDVRDIYRGCISEGACKGRYPNIRWNCNNVGDEVNDPSHVCFCDSSCNLNATQIKNS